METYTLGQVERRFADIIWENAPLTTGELVKLCGEKLNWKRTTTYTVLKKFSERGLFENRQGTVYVRVSKDDFLAGQSEYFVEQSFSGSLPGFLAAFTSRRKLGRAEIEEIQKIIEDSEDSEDS